MYIEIATSTRYLYDESIMAGEYAPPGVEFSEAGVANVRKEVGKALVEQYDSIEIHDNSESETEAETESDPDSSSDSDADADNSETEDN